MIGRARRPLAWLLVLPLFLVPAGGAAMAQADDPPPFRGTVSKIDADTRDLMTGRSWHEGCPVGFDKLRILSVRYWGFDKRVHMGRLVVHRAFAWGIVRVFHSMYWHRYPVHRVRLVDRYDADDLESMKHDNTSAFNCRWRAGQPGVWSMHAYGKALDLNPFENPYVRGSHVSPPGSRKYLDRSKHAKGMIHAGDVAVRAFTNIGWEWGGAWTGSEVDYQHFSANGH
ncbi:MAG TPA: M15 family metallopeptidase [Actinomycetota bacterium]